MKLIFEYRIFLVLVLFISLAGCTNYAKKGMEEYEKGNYQAAIEDLTKAINNNPNDDLAFDLLSHVYRDYTQAPNNRDYAYKYASQAIKVCSEGNTIVLADHYLTLGDLYRVDGNYNEALKNLKKSISLYPGDYQAQFFYGVSLYATGNNSSGISHIKQSLKLNPDYQNAKNFLNNPSR